MPGVSLIFRWAVLAVAAVLAFGCDGACPARRSRRRAPAGGTITAVQIQGNVRAEPETIRSYLQLKEGQPYDAGGGRPLAEGAVRDRPVRRRRDRHAGLDPGRQGHREPDHQPRRLRGQQQDRGRQAARRSAVASRARSSRAPGCRPTSSASSTSTAAAAATTRRSSPRSSSSTRTASTSSSRSTKATSPASSASASSATRHFSDGTLRGKIRTKESAWYRFLSSDDRYDPDRLNLDRELLRKFYLSEGYADFRVVSAVAELAPEPRGLLPHLHDQRRRALQVRQGRGHRPASRGSMSTSLKSYLTMARGRLVRRRRGREDRRPR